MGGADPDKVEVGEYPGQPEGQAPGDHDAQVGERQHGQDGQADRDGLREADDWLFYKTTTNQIMQKYYELKRLYQSHSIIWLII